MSSSKSVLSTGRCGSGVSTASQRCNESVSDGYSPRQETDLICDDTCGNPTLSKALEYAENGLAVLPLAPGGKVPLSGTNGVHDATTDAETIRSWFREYPDANLGIATGEPSGFFALDADGKRGKESLKKMIERYAETPPEWITPTNETPNGQHILFNLPDFDVPNSVGLRKNLDVRGDGGYIVAPPSTHPSGEPYEWNPYLSIHDLDPADAPGWLLDEIRPSSQADEATTEWLDTSDLTDDYEGDVHPAVVATRRAGKPLEELEPGERNEQIFRAKLTWCNLGEDPAVFDTWFLDEVLPEMNQGPGHDGEKFRRTEAVQTLRNAEKGKYQDTIPDELEAYFTADTEPAYTKGPDEWTTVELCRILLAFFERYGTLELDSRDFDNGGIVAGLLESVEQWIDRHWTHKDPVPSSSLKKALTYLEKSGHIRTETRDHKIRDDKGRITGRYTTGTYRKGDPSVDSSIAVRERLKPTDIIGLINGCFLDGVDGVTTGKGQETTGFGDYPKGSNPPDYRNGDSKGDSVEVEDRPDSKKQLLGELKRQFSNDFENDSTSLNEDGFQ